MQGIRLCEESIANAPPLPVTWQVTGNVWFQSTDEISALKAASSAPITGPTGMEARMCFLIERASISSGIIRKAGLHLMTRTYEQTLRPPIQITRAIRRLVSLI